MNVSVSSQLSNEGSVTNSGPLLTDTLVMVVLTLARVGKVQESIHVLVAHIARMHTMMKMHCTTHANIVTFAYHRLRGNVHVDNDAHTVCIYNS